mgnify:CR=1
MSQFIKWSREFSVQDGFLDDQHKQIYELINQLHTALKNREADHQLTQSIMKQLTEYTLKHFSAEERLMAKYQYPNLNKHKEQHQMMARRTRELSRQVMNTNSDDTHEILLFLRDWWQQHILKQDMQYVPLSKWSK